MLVVGGGGAAAAAATTENEELERNNSVKFVQFLDLKKMEKEMIFLDWTMI